MSDYSKLKENFIFTQHSLSTFDSCPLKFRKRYVEGLRWDSFPEKDIARRLELGQDFHLLANRYFIGIDPGLEKSTEAAQELTDWMKSLRGRFPLMPDAAYFSEYKLRMAKEILKLEANFDLLLIKDGCIEIWDWKTHGGRDNYGRGAARRRLADSLQTKVYMFVLKEKAHLIFGEDISCHSISMHYWQPEPAGTLASIQYDDATHDEFRNTLERKIAGILEYDYAEFDKELYKKHCKFCEFNWLCNREKVDFMALEESEEFLAER